MVRFGLIGCGKHAQWAVMPAMKLAPSCTLVAVADPVQANLDSIEDPAVHRHREHREMLARTDLDAIYVATPADVHCAVTLDALRSGRHVLCEKPLGMDVAECRQMVDAARRHNRFLAVDFETRFIAAYRQARQWIIDGHIGTIRAVHINSFWDGHKAQGPLAERRHRFLDKTGCLDCGIHRIDLVRFFCGGGTWQDVQALGAWFGEKCTFPPHIAILARLTPGILVTVNASFAHTAYIKARHLHEAFVIIGEKGVIVLEGNPGNLVFRLVSDSRCDTAPLQEEGHDQVIPRVLEAFAAALVPGATPDPTLATGDDGLMAQIAVDAANQEAIRRGDASR